MSIRRKLARPAIWALYLFIVLEFLFMISPFALYFYSTYGPALNVLHASPTTAWLTGFFLPHFSATESVWLGWTKTAGFLLAGAGSLLFLAGAVQVYGGKLLRRGAVTGGLYRLSRHPQYTALAVLGLGVVLIWPRFLVLLGYVTMLFLYVLLARWEEERCVARFGAGYRRYRERTGRFLPRLRSPSRRRRELHTALLPIFWLAAVVLAIVCALGLRELSFSRLSVVWAGDTVVLSPATLETAELVAAHELASTAPAVREARSGAVATPWIVYVVPDSWYLADLPLHDWFELPADKRRGHVTPSDFDRSRYKVLFTRARTHRSSARDRDILRSAYSRTPLARVHVDLLRGEVSAVETPPDHVVWGDIPTPLF